MRPAARRITWIALWLALTSAPALALAEPGARAVEGVSIVVADLDRSVRFFEQALDFRKVAEAELAGDDWERALGVFAARVRVAVLQLGDERIELRQYLAQRGRPMPVDSRSNDEWFQHVAIIVSDMDAAYARLRSLGVEHASSGPQRLPDWNPNAGGIEAFYFKDPDGHPLEILAFPKDKGAAKWHEAGDRLFLGIDHTAIVVEETGPSLRAWRDALGLDVAGESENHGTEQEHLNAVFGARLRITGLRAQHGPGVEFLDYLAPTDGRPAPADARPNDLASVETRVAVPDIEAAAQRILAAGLPMITPGVVTTPLAELGFTRSLLVRDPDGHFVRLFQQENH